MGLVEQQLLLFLQNVYEAIGWPGVILLMAIESALIPLPSELIMPLSGWMLIQAKGHPASYTLLAGFYGALGNLLGSLLAYWWGAKGGRPLLERYGRYVLITPRDLERADRWFSRYGDLIVLISRMLPVVRTFISFPAGVSRMNLLRFSLYTFVGSFPWALGLAYGGYLLGENWESLRRAMRPFDYPILVIAALLIALYIWHHLRAFRAQTTLNSSPKPPEDSTP